MLFRNIIPEFNSQKEIHLIRIIDTTKKKKISFYDSSWMRAGIVITYHQYIWLHLMFILKKKHDGNMFK